MIYAIYMSHILAEKMIADKKISVIIVTNMHLIINVPLARLLLSTILTSISESTHRVSAFFSKTVEWHLFANTVSYRLYKNVEYKNRTPLHSLY